MTISWSYRDLLDFGWAFLGCLSRILSCDWMRKDSRSGTKIGLGPRVEVNLGPGVKVGLRVRVEADLRSGVGESLGFEAKQGAEHLIAGFLRQTRGMVIIERVKKK